MSQIPTEGKMRGAKADTTDLNGSSSDHGGDTKKSDAYARFSVSSNQGRGSLTGWVQCPLCPLKSQKRFSGGRGIAAHLHAVHTPWKPPSQKELKRRRRQQQAASTLLQSVKRRKLSTPESRSAQINDETNDQSCELPCQKTYRHVPRYSRTRQSQDR